MKHLLELSLLLMCLMSCNLLRNSKSSVVKEELLHTNETEFHSAQEQLHMEDFKVTTLFKDTMNHTYQVEIWPKGAFSLTDESGFLGEASKVLISGTANRGYAAKVLKERSTVDQELQRVDWEDTAKVKHLNAEKVTQNSPSWKWILAVLVSGVFAVYGLRRFYKR